MNSKLQIKSVTLADKDLKSGLFQYIMTLADGSRARLFYSNKPEWHLTGVTRLLNVPCPLCMKDYYCGCFEKNAELFDRQVNEHDFIPASMRA
ncbi:MULTISPECIES: hypothetical protein [Paenibacillus]|uniref:Uncharacterized protein n=1 Tax=Paenibacillus glycanilyticus TaxID=126569 RepID=A0ABQ6NIT9_9BACL|nr:MULTISPECIES: hypothetical protein [Paenibacillus]MCK9859933.1 hypothetical protein [Paenibacillus sp. ATY16]MCM3630709.1 hypothetical protein [Paenibacillus glycanilyticus]NIK70719.1 hypothetical protein [Paenibacillus sp. BK720]GMK45031.1 hypothetical protein PghCCS26_21590 [Paenibacillus glycanilyticus]